MKNNLALYNIFEKFSNDLINLNIKNNLIERKEVFLKVYININYDFNEYDKSIEQIYYFLDSWNFKHICSKVFDASIKDSFLITDEFKESNDFSVFLRQYQTKYCRDFDIEELLSLVNEQNCIGITDSISDYFNGTLMHNSDLRSSVNFHIKALEILGINNNNHEITYHGSYYADSLGMDYRSSYCSHVELICSKDNLPFYKELLLEAYSLILEGNYKMAYFNAFAAFENFVNLKSGKASSEERLSDKFKDAYNSHSIIQEFSSNETYRQLKNSISHFTDIRNSIAHGRHNDDIWGTLDIKQTTINMYIYASIVIMCFEEGFKNFNELKKYLKYKPN